MQSSGKLYKIFEGFLIFYNKLERKFNKISFVKIFICWQMAIFLVICFIFNNNSASAQHQKSDTEFFSRENNNVWPEVIET